MTASPASPPARAESHPPSVLVVDDEKALQRQLLYVLEDAGCRVATAGSGSEAAKILESERFEVALMDIRLPDVDGIQLLELARARQPDISVLVMTGQGSLETSIKAMFLGAVGYLLKPVDPSALVGQVVEAAEKARAKRQHREQLEHVLEELERHRAVASCLESGLVTLGADGRVTAVAPEALALLGLAADRAVGLGVWQLARGGAPEAAATAAPVGESEARAARSAAAPERAALVTPSSTGALAQDKNLVNQLLVTSRLAAIGNLAAGVAHEINNPLQVIQGWSEKLRSEGADALRRELAVDRIQKSVTRCVTIIKNVAKAAAPKEVLARPIRLPSVAGGVVDLMRHELPSRNIRLTVNYPENLPPVLADEDEMHQIFLNLMLNARDAMPEGGEISIVMEPAGSHVQVKVSDTGTGIPGEVVGKIFDPFFTTKGPDRGTGLGLYVTYSLVSKYRGQIKVDSTPGRGTTMTLLFPACQAAGEERGVETGAPDQPVQALDILLVDDEEPIIELLGAWLQDKGHTLTAVSSGEAAVELAERESFDLIIMDLKMPGMGGWNALQNIRQKLPAVPVIILTGSLEPGVPESEDPESRVILIKKPVRLAHLDSTIAHISRPVGGLILSHR